MSYGTIIPVETDFPVEKLDDWLGETSLGGDSFIYDPSTSVVNGQPMYCSMEFTAVFCFMKIAILRAEDLTITDEIGPYHFTYFGFKGRQMEPDTATVWEPFPTGIVSPPFKSIPELAVNGETDMVLELFELITQHSREISAP